MTMIVTDAGIASSRNADLGGYLISLEEFALTEATGFEVTPDRTALVGAEVFRGLIESVEAIGMNSIRLTCRIPAGVPATGQLMASEIGIFDAAGQLFAHGDIVPFPKTGDFGLKFYVYVTMGRIGAVVNITTSETYSLPSAASVATLLPPVESAQNALVVLDGNSHKDEIDGGMPATTSSPSLALKYGPGGSYWAFSGHSRVYIGDIGPVLNTGSFGMNPGAFGFWLSEGEVVIVQVTAGAGAGHSRKMRFSAVANRLSAIGPGFPSLNATSKITVWRSHEAALPTRHAGIPDYMVLGVGKNTYATTTTSAQTSSLYARRATLSGNGGSTYQVPAGQVPLSQLDSKDSLILMVAGVTRIPSSYSYNGTTLTINGGVPQGAAITLWGFVREPGQGSETVLQEVDIAVHGGLEYQLPAVPGSAADVLVLNGTSVLPSSSYAINGARLVFTQSGAPTTGTLTILCAGYIQSEAVRGSLVRTQIVVGAAPLNVVETNTVFASLRNAIVFINGEYMPRSRYSTVGSKLRFRTPVVSCTLDILNLQAVDVVSIAGRSGNDEGPQWVDPAGNEGRANRLTPSRRRHVGNGQQSFACDPVESIEYLMVFVGDRYLPPTDFHYDGQYVWPNVLVTGNKPVEIISFKTAEHPGTEARPKGTTVAGNGGVTYTIHANANTASLIVFVDGNYIPVSARNYEPTTGALTLTTAVPAASTITAWSYEDVSAPGKQVRMFADVQTISQVRPYPVSAVLSAETDMVAFRSGGLVPYSMFNLLTSQGFSFLEYVNIPPASIIGQDLQIVSFSTRVPTSRLVLRSEVLDLVTGQFLGKPNNLADVPDKPAARDNLGITPLLNSLTNNFNALANNALLKPNNLADVPNKAAARDNLGITAQLASIINNMLIKQNNLADVPNKAQARANLGIPDVPQMNWDVWFDPGNGNWRLRLNDLVIIGGRYRHPSVVSEVQVWIPFHTQLGGVLSVTQSTWIPAQSKYWDGISQLIGTPNGNGFNIQVQTSDSNDRKWQGLDYIAIGWAVGSSGSGGQAPAPSPAPSPSPSPSPSPAPSPGGGGGGGGPGGPGEEEQQQIQ